MIKYLYLNDKSNFDFCMEIDKGSCTIGAFDGIHLGHLKIFNELINNSEGYKKIIITFSNHPDYSLNKRDDFGLINSNEEKIEIFNELGFDYAIFLDNMFLEYDYSNFNKLLKKLNIQKIFLGNDFHYGKNGIGDINTLKKDFLVSIVSDYYYNDKRLSSTLIRLLLIEGKIKELNKLLVKPFSIEGTIKSGNKIGRTIGFKTANIDYSNKFRLLKYGVYSCNVIVNNKTYNGLANYGNYPTVNVNNKPILEVYIIDFDKDLYGEKIIVIFRDYIREEKKFDSLEELKMQIKKDIGKAGN